MKAAVFKGANRPLSIESVDDPTPGPGEIVVRVARCGICGTDLHLTEAHGGGADDDMLAAACAPGTILGHEIGGEIVALGPGVGGLRIGDHVTSMGMAGCGTCAACRSGEPIWCPNVRPQMGGYAEYARLQQDACLTMPSTLSMEDCSLVEPFAFAWNAVESSGLKTGQHAIIIGAGPVGLSIAFFAARKGASVVIAARSGRAADLAGAYGDFRLIDTLGAEVADGGRLADVVFECVGRPGLIDRAIDFVRPRGAVLVAGLCFAPDTFNPLKGILKGIHIRFVNAYSVNDFQAAADVMERDPHLPRRMVTDTVSLAGLPAMFEALRGRGHQCKVMIDPFKADG